jgi:transposase-like protein
VLGIAPGSSENHHVAKDLLRNLIDRGLDPERARLFGIDGSKALRKKAILELFGPGTPVQRCRAHKLRNVVERLPKEERDQTKNAMRAAWRLDEKEGRREPP